jgi:hypothetical protein
MSDYKQVDISHQYVVINTGYTSRITKNGGCREEFFKMLREHCLLGDDCANVKLLFVEDKLWGEQLDPTTNGLFIESDDVAEVNLLINCLKKIGIYKYGIACFKCTDDDYYALEQTVLDSTYCRAYDVSFQQLWQADGLPTIKYVSFDAESG